MTEPILPDDEVATEAERIGMQLLARGLVMSLISLMILSSTSSSVTALGLTPEVPWQQVVDTSAERAAYGLPSDFETVHWLLTSGADVGTSRWGVSMSADEEHAVDFPNRIAFMSDAHARLIPYVESLQSYAGYSVDQRSGIRITTDFTDADQAHEAAAAISGLAPAGGVVAVRVVRHSKGQLEEAQRALSLIWAVEFPDEGFHGSSVDTFANSLVVYVNDRPLHDTRTYQRRLEDALGVSVSISIDGPITLTHCTSRRHCDYPMKAGALLVGPTGLDRCGMGFHVRFGTYDEQFLTAAHCGYGQSGSWYMQSYGWIGNEKDADEYCIQDGIDVMTVDFSPASENQVSDDIYGGSTNIIGWTTVGPGETVWASRAKTGLDSGVVFDSSYQYFDPNCGSKPHWGQTVTGISSVDGDSGSPVFRRDNLADSWAVGTIVGNNPSGRLVFAKIWIALSRYGVNLVT